MLVVLVAAPQTYAGYVTQVARESVDEVFVEGPATSGAWKPAETAAPTVGPTAAPGTSASPSPTASPSPSPTPTTPRINVLIIGVDSGVGRTTFLTDTMIVASLDPVGETVSLLSFPRDLVDVPLPGGGRYGGKLNSLLAYARSHPRAFPGSSGDGHDVLMAALGEMTGLQIDYYAQVNLGGFVAVINAMSGIQVNVARGFCDPTYHSYGYPNGFSITAGRHKLNGTQALAYARVRKASGESDFSRQERQQEVLSGIRDRVVKGGFLDDPIAFLRSTSRTVETNIPRKLVPTLVEYAQRVDRSATYRDVVSGGSLIQSGLRQPGLRDLRRLQGHPQAGERAVHRAGHDPRRPVPGAEAGGRPLIRQRRLQLRPGGDAEAPQGHPEADTEAPQGHPEADTKADVRSHAGADAGAGADARALTSPSSTGSGAVARAARRPAADQWGRSVMRTSGSVVGPGPSTSSISQVRSNSTPTTPPSA